MQKWRFVFIASIFIINATIFAQTNDSNNRLILSNIDSLRIAKLSLGAFKITPFIIPSYSPEVEGMLSAGSLISYSTQKNNHSLERSSLSVAVGYSTNKSIAANVRSIIYGKKDNLRLQTVYWYKNMPDHYWGIGYGNGMHVKQSDSTTYYHKNWSNIIQKASFRLFKNIFIGGIIDYCFFEATDINEKMKYDPKIINQGSTSKNFGIGTVIQYDTRDYIQNTYSGMLFEFSYTHFDKLFWGDSKFDYLKFDYRRFFTIKRERQTLAFEGQVNIGMGNIPWTELSQLGSANDLRGYYWGRFRDKSTAFGIAEYRHMFRRFKASKTGSYDSKFGYVIWLGYGAIGSKKEDFKNWLPNYGLGVRVELQPRLNLRLDYGFGKDSKGVYFTFTESF
ncbi:MAG: BamA/TamA family outer membrane protein [Marinilabiliaceae bacterium]|nr:BamA/TamA family outer membrane protein [Marinilabiliaceae bacterium]